MDGVKASAIEKYTIRNDKRMTETDPADRKERNLLEIEYVTQISTVGFFTE
jgi:hypothetical protein